MPRLRPLIFLLLSLTSVHVLVADAGAHEQRLTGGGEVLAHSVEHAGHEAGQGHSLLQHCCQCHGFVAPLATLVPARRPAAASRVSPAPAMPPAPAFGFYRPPKSLV
jgi:hypothetical protein